MSGEENGEQQQQQQQQTARPMEHSVQDLSHQQESPSNLGTIPSTPTVAVHPLESSTIEPGVVVPPIGPPPAYQEIYPTQPHYWNGQLWPPPPPMPPPHSMLPPTPWSIHSRTVTYYNHPRRLRTFRRFGGQITNPARVPSAARWFFGTVTFMMIFSIVSAFVYVLIVTANVK